jgi:polyisoprenoid-binding protein YceI
MRQLLFVSLTLGLLTACSAKTKASTQNIPNTTLTVAPKALPVEPPTTKAMTFMISPEGSSIIFVGAKTTRSHEGKFGSFSGVIQVPEKNALEKSSVSVEVTMSNFETDQEKLTLHLKTADFFDVVRFPVATFVSTEVKPYTEDGATHLIVGDLNFHGVKKSIQFPAKISITEGALVANSEFSFNRQDFGVSYPGMASDPIKDQVLLKLNLRATPK